MSFTTFPPSHSQSTPVTVSIRREVMRKYSLNRISTGRLCFVDKTLNRTCFYFLLFFFFFISVKYAGASQRLSITSVLDKGLWVYLRKQSLGRGWSGLTDRLVRPRPTSCLLRTLIRRKDRHYNKSWQLSALSTASHNPPLHWNGGRTKAYISSH